MTIARRDILKAAIAASVLPRVAAAAPASTPKPAAWRAFELVTEIEIANPEGPTQAWVPLPSVDEALWFRPRGTGYKTNAASATIHRDERYGAQLLHLTWPSGEIAPRARIVSRVWTRDRAIDFDAPAPAPISDAERSLYTAPTTLIPTDGIVRTVAERITAGAQSELAKARAIYDWIVENAYRNQAARGCGLGNIAFMLETGDLGGKCADHNGLFVGLARAVGLPARDIYGIRAAPSKSGCKSLGAGTQSVTGAQHCRAEVYLTGIGWVPVDPADVRKVMIEEPPCNLTLGDDRVAAARKALFGAAESNWIAYNRAHDVALPGAKEGPVGFLMYPEAETASCRLDCLDPDTFRYTIEAREVSVA